MRLLSSRTPSTVALPPPSLSRALWSLSSSFCRPIASRCCAVSDRWPWAHGDGGNLSCNIFKGEWVPDPGAPRYTTEACRVIHGHYDCMRYGRPDLGFVRWRWRPTGCELPRFDSAWFLRPMRGKSMAFVGDSLARNQMHSLVCLLARAEQPATTTNASYVFRFERHGYVVSLFLSPSRRTRTARRGAGRGCGASTSTSRTRGGRRTLASSTTWSSHRGAGSSALPYSTCTGASSGATTDSRPMSPT